VPADKPLVPNGTFPDPKERTPTLLIVEDEALIRVALSDYLQDCGYKVLDASTADEAVLIIEQGEAIIDLVFSDVKMPGSMDGFGLAQWLRANRPGLPIILTSGDEKKTSAAKELCETEPFMAKPYDLKMVVAKIRATINSSRTKPR
jgi:DNA-binding response OmpR family regulator